MGPVAPVASGTASRSRWTGAARASSISPTSVLRKDEVGRATKRPASIRRRPLCFRPDPSPPWARRDIRCVDATCAEHGASRSPYTRAQQPRRRGATLAYLQEAMKTLRLALLAALAVGCHFDKLFQPSSSTHAPPTGSTKSRLTFTTQPHSTMKDSTIPPVEVTA